MKWAITKTSNNKLCRLPKSNCRDPTSSPFKDERGRSTGIWSSSSNLPSYSVLDPTVLSSTYFRLVLPTYFHHLHHCQLPHDPLRTHHRLEYLFQNRHHHHLWGNVPVVLSSCHQQPGSGHWWGSDRFLIIIKPHEPRESQPKKTLQKMQYPGKEKYSALPRLRRVREWIRSSLPLDFKMHWGWKFNQVLCIFRNYARVFSVRFCGLCDAYVRSSYSKCHYPLASTFDSMTGPSALKMVKAKWFFICPIYM